MSNILLLGLTDHEAAAVEILIGMHWHDHHCVTLKRALSLAVPEQNGAARACGYCVIDLFGIGQRRYSPENAARLRQILDGRPAVLLTGGTGGGWLQADPGVLGSPFVNLVSMPYSSATLREAIRKMKNAVECAPAPDAPVHDMRALAVPPMSGLAARQPARATASSVPAWRRAMELADELKRSGMGGAAVASLAPARKVQARAVPRALAATEPVSLAPSAVRLSAEAVGLGKGALQALCEVFPALSEQPLIELTRKIVHHDGALLLCIGSEAVLIADARQGWLASGLPVSALLKMLHTLALVEDVAMQSLEAERIEEMMRQRFGGKFHLAQKPLDVITWELMSDLLEHLSLQRRGDLTIQLRRFPNFPMLAGIGPLDFQLAAICARMPQSITDLLRAFPRHQEAVQRFVVLSVVSGLAKVLQTSAPSASTAAQRVPGPAAARPPGATARRGFFKSLFDKLF